MTPAVDPHPAAVPKPQEGSPSGDWCQSLFQPLQLLRTDSELGLQSEIREENKSLLEQENGSLIV